MTSSLSPNFSRVSSLRTSSLRSAYIDQVFERGDLYRLFRIPAHSFSKNLRILRVITPIRACLHSPRSGSRFGQCVREKACRVSRYALLFPWKLIGFSCFFFSYGGKFRGKFLIFYGIFFRIFNNILTFSQVSDLDVFKIEIGCDNLSAGRDGDSKIFKFNSSCRKKKIYMTTLVLGNNRFKRKNKEAWKTFPVSRMGNSFKFLPGEHPYYVYQNP